MRLHRAGVKDCSRSGSQSPFLKQVGLDVVDQRIGGAFVVFMDHHARPFVAQKDLIVFVDDGQPGLDLAEGLFRVGLFKKFIVDI